MAMAVRKPALDSQSDLVQPMRWGDLLAELRISAGLTQKEVADQLITHQTMISHLEMGKVAPTLEWARRLDRVLGTGTQLTRAFELLEPFLGQPHPSWDWIGEFTRAEGQSRRIHELQTGRVSGLLQTEGYMRAVSPPSRRGPPRMRSRPRCGPDSVGRPKCSGSAARHWSASRSRRPFSELSVLQR
jgi:transcriptional regulator with XRE-family HTH domain